MTLELQLAPGFLLSMPQLDDPNFTRAVVLMLQHDEEGSFGLIVNQASNLTTADLAEQIGVTWRGNDTDRVFVGGPVMPGSAWMLHSGSELLPASSTTIDGALEETGQMQIAEKLFLTTSDSGIRKLLEAPPKQSRLVLGYAGWGGGQLAAEMREGAWLHGDLDTELLFASETDELWERCLQATGIDAMSVVSTRGVH